MSVASSSRVLSSGALEGGVRPSSVYHDGDTRTGSRTVLRSAALSGSTLCPGTCCWRMAGGRRGGTGCRRAENRDAINLALAPTSRQRLRVFSCVFAGIPPLHCLPAAIHARSFIFVSSGRSLFVCDCLRFHFIGCGYVRHTSSCCKCGAVAVEQKATHEGCCGRGHHC